MSGPRTLRLTIISFDRHYLSTIKQDLCLFSLKISFSDIFTKSHPLGRFHDLESKLKLANQNRFEFEELLELLLFLYFLY